jgi:hypothetical protein
MSTDFIKGNMPEVQALEAGCQWLTIALVLPTTANKTAHCLRLVALDVILADGGGAFPPKTKNIQTRSLAPDALAPLKIWLAESDDDYPQCRKPPVPSLRHPPVGFIHCLCLQRLLVTPQLQHNHLPIGHGPTIIRMFDLTHDALFKRLQKSLTR